MLFFGKYPVSQAQWEAVMGNNPAKFPGKNRPVEQVSWYDCLEFCKKLGVQQSDNFRLPSEAEWEYACRAGTTSPFYFGETLTTELANYNGNYIYANEAKGIYREETTTVGMFPANAFGLYDMHGNVWEWCLDNYHNNYQGAPVDGKAWREDDSYYHIIRGGSYLVKSSLCRCSERNRNDPNFTFKDGGLRVVITDQAN